MPEEKEPLFTDEHHEFLAHIISYCIKEAKKGKNAERLASGIGKVAGALHASLYADNPYMDNVKFGRIVTDSFTQDGRDSLIEEILKAVEDTKNEPVEVGDTSKKD